MLEFNCFNCLTERISRSVKLVGSPGNIRQHTLSLSLYSVPHYGLPLPFGYESTGVVTRFTNRLNPFPRSREVFTFHRPEELKSLLDVGDKKQLRSRLQTMPELEDGKLWPIQRVAITNLEKSLSENRPRSLIQMTMGSGKTFTAVSSVYRLNT